MGLQIFEWLVNSGLEGSYLMCVDTKTDKSVVLPTALFEDVVFELSSERQQWPAMWAEASQEKEMAISQVLGSHKILTHSKINKKQNK